MLEIGAQVSRNTALLNLLIATLLDKGVLTTEDLTRIFEKAPDAVDDLAVAAGTLR